MRPIRLVPALAILALGAAAPGLSRDRPIPEATPDGKAVDCVWTTALDQSRVRSDGVIDFYMKGGKVYRNTLPNSCPSLGFEQRFSYKVSTSQLCSTDIIRVLYDAGGLREGAGCGLGKFQPVKIAKAVR